jgi:type IV pilus assembly protein PilP
MMMKQVLPLLLAAAVVAGCSSRDDELDKFIAQTKLEQPGGAEPLPEVKPSDSFDYEAQAMRSPFQPGGASDSPSNVRPNNKRNREFLETFPLDTIKMVGTLSMSGRNFGLVKTRDGLVQRVVVGNYVGQADGRITAIEPSKISITEIVADGLGGFTERSTELRLNE